MTWTRCSDRWPPANTSNIAVKMYLSGIDGVLPRVARTTEGGTHWRGPNGLWQNPIHPDDLYLILPAVPEGTPSTSTPS